ALFYSDIGASASCRFTANTIQGAPIMLNKKHLRANRQFRGILVNSGNANCFTGEAGLKDAQESAESLASALRVDKKSILLASTGIIGRRLPIAKIKKALPLLIKGLSKQGIDKAKRAIFTTDTFTKEFTVSFNIGKRSVIVCGIAKGAGMIAPNLATMLAFIFTDANITQRAIDKALGLSVGNSFNCITVDGCMSTNDTVAILANGAAGNKTIDINPAPSYSSRKLSRRRCGVYNNFNLFTRALNRVSLELAQLIVRDAEGATKFIRIKVNKAKSFPEAKKVALHIANSSLFKVAMFGENPNFGRIVSAVGASGLRIKAEDLKIKVSPLNKKEIDVEVYLNRGDASAIIYTSDLTPEYVKINAEYN
ncbi:MAG: bifunctional glutamate N-acetyltransferase/amino-acid acetyltransferase ArgJ, partial [Candidatus Omnitrophica bacterium]|nr:bifunctional glutamate N-acetyltransferase/amino-acid acetyltransferase ArgJ [Candidatus Omnitrophota bacterium]